MSIEEQIEEGYKSKDVVKIKAARGTAKFLVTNMARWARQKVLYDLFVDEEAYRKLGVEHNQFQDLHERYLNYREKKSDPEDEKVALEIEESYAQDVEKEFSKSVRSYIKYSKAPTASINVNDDIKAEDSARYSITADAVEEVKNKTKALSGSISKETSSSIKT